MNRKTVKKYNKYYNVFVHFTNNYIPFRNMIQDTINKRRLKVIKKGRLKFEKKSMKVDIDPFNEQVAIVKPIMIIDTVGDINP